MNGNKDRIGNVNYPPSVHGDGDYNGDDPNLPPDFDGPVPSGDDFVRAAHNALADEVTFILLHGDDPQAITNRLPRLLDRLRAVIAIKGGPQARAIRWLLRIEPRYWLACYRFKEWGELLKFMVSLARDLKDDALYADVLHAWGKYLGIYHKMQGAELAFDWGLELLETIADEDVKLLLRLEKFNATVINQPREQVLSMADELLVQARALKSHYFQGRIYHTVARYFRNTSSFADAFAYGQQALCYYWSDPEAWLELIAQVMLTMNAVLRNNTTGSEVHQERIVQYLDDLLWRVSFNPLVAAKILHEHAVQHYSAGRYEQAKRFILQAGIRYRLTNDDDGWARARHVWGQAQRELGYWTQAERHLYGAAKLYDQLENDQLVVLARLSCALIPYQQRDWARAHGMLVETRSLAEQRIATMTIRERRIAEIDRYLDEVCHHLDCDD